MNKEEPSHFVDVSRKSKIVMVDGKPVGLSKNEMSLFNVLKMVANSEPISVELLTKLCKFPNVQHTRVEIKRLRDKIGEDLIINEKEVGYILNAMVSTEK